jgi:hypothetical protein
MTVMGNDIVNFLKQYIGTPYQWGGNDLSKGVDCSGLIQQGFKHFGINLPRTSYSMWSQGEGVSMNGLRVGDLVFFDIDRKKPGPDHVAIYAGGGMILEAPSPGKKVKLTDMTQPYYANSFMGGRRISGVWAENQNPGDNSDPTKAMTPEELASSYGFTYAFLEGNKDLKKIFSQAVKETWSTDKFQAAIRDTHWWKTNSESMRQAQITQKTDPATWDAMVDAETIKIKQLAAEIGAAIPSKKLKHIVETALKTNMDEGLLRDMLGKYVDFTKNGTLHGEAGMHEFTMKEYAASMGINLDDQTIKNQAQRVVRKVATTQDYESLVRDSAKSMYPSYAKQIDSGLTVKDIASPYIQMMGQTLEIPDTDITVFDPTIKGALNGLSSDGKPTGLSLTDFQQKLRNDPRWRKTDAAQDNVFNVGHEVLKQMGLTS